MTNDKLALSKLFKKPHVILVQKPYVIDAVHECSHPIDAKPEGETRELFRIDIDCLEHIRMDHSASTEFDPTRSLADSTTCSSANVATEVDLGARLHKREIGWPEPGSKIGPEH